MIRKTSDRTRVLLRRLQQYGLESKHVHKAVQEAWKELQLDLDEHVVTTTEQMVHNSLCCSCAVALLLPLCGYHSGFKCIAYYATFSQTMSLVLLQTMSLVLLQTISLVNGCVPLFSLFLFTHSQSYTHTHSLSLVLVVMMKSKELKTKIYSHTHSLIHSSLSSLCPPSCGLHLSVCVEAT